MREKLRSRAGFTLVEMLCVVLILSLMGIMVGNGLGMAVNAYGRMTAEAETQLLLNSLTNAIAGELRCAFDVEGGTGDAKTSPKYNGGAWLDWNSGQVLVRGEPGGDKELLPKENAVTGGGGAYKNGEYVVEEMSVTYDEAVSCFTLELKVARKDSDISAETPAGGVVIRCLNPAKTA